MFSHIFNLEGLNNTLLSQGCALENGCSCVNGGCNVHSKDQGEGVIPLMACVQLMGQPAVMSSPRPPVIPGQIIQLLWALALPLRVLGVSIEIRYVTLSIQWRLIHNTTSNTTMHPLPFPKLTPHFYFIRKTKASKTQAMCVKSNS